MRLRRARTWTLRTRLVLSAVALIAVVCAVIGTVTTIALRSHLYEQVDEKLGGAVRRVSGPPVKLPDPAQHDAQRDAQRDANPDTTGDTNRDPLRFVVTGPQDIGAIGAVVGDDGTVTRAVVSTEVESSSGRRQTTASGLDREQIDALNSVPKDKKPHSVDLPGLGGYRVQLAEGSDSDLLVGLPTAAAENTVNTLIAVEVSVTAAGLVAASLAGAAIVGVALRPLRRVAATATRVSELPLHHGEVAPLERVRGAEADPRTEVGQVGAALNRMLGHVGSALAARQESETRVRRFVADASHELRTPLASIRGYAELTRRGHDQVGPDTRHALGRIESEAQRMTGMVEDLLLLARLDAGQSLPYEHHASVDLSPLVVDAVSDAHAAGQRHVWRLELPDEPALVLGDEPRIHQILVNLLANARTHTPPGTTVTARVRAHGAYLRIDVEDDGPGIAPELLPRVFERFARGDASRSRTAGSTGLGLAIVHAVTTAHGGSVSVASEPGRTVFSVRLPTAPQDRTETGTTTTTAADNSQAGHSLTTRG